MMKHQQTLRDRPPVQFIRQTMRIEESTLVADSAVPRRDTSPGPFPASLSALDLGPETFSQVSHDPSIHERRPWR